MIDLVRGGERAVAANYTAYFRFINGNNSIITAPGAGKYIRVLGMQYGGSLTPAATQITYGFLLNVYGTTTQHLMTTCIGVTPRSVYASTVCNIRCKENTAVQCRRNGTSPTAGEIDAVVHYRIEDGYGVGP